MHPTLPLAICVLFARMKPYRTTVKTLPRGPALEEIAETIA
jgi:hypothetical protein